MAVHALVGRFIHRVEVVDVADSFQVWEDAGADHEGKEVYSNQDSGTGAEGDEESRRVDMVGLKLDLHHGDHGKSRQ